MPLPPATFPFAWVLASRTLSELATSAVPTATYPQSLVSRTDANLLKSEEPRKTCCQDSAPVAVVLAGQEAAVGP